MEIFLRCFALVRGGDDLLCHPFNAPRSVNIIVHREFNSVIGVGDKGSCGVMAVPVGIGNIDYQVEGVGVRVVNRIAAAGFHYGVFIYHISADVEIFNSVVIVIHRLRDVVEVSCLRIDEAEIADLSPLGYL